MVGCTKVSQGCKNCYADKTYNFVKRMGQATEGYDKTFFAGPQLMPAKMHAPLNWKKPQTIFVCSMSDFFHAQIPDGYRRRVWEVILRCPQHTFQILTKRPKAMRRFIQTLADAPPPNVHFGVTVEDVKTAKTRLPVLLDMPVGPTYFLSCEPLLADVYKELCGCDAKAVRARVKWVIVGGESGDKGKARKMDKRWVECLASYCRRHRIAYFFKQTGRVIAEEECFKDKKGGDVEAVMRAERYYSDDIYRREFPKHAASKVS